MMSILERYEVLKTKVVDRRQPFQRFIEMLEAQTSWLTSPASTKYHLNKEGGLLEHSVGVAESLLRFRQFLAPHIDEERCVIIGLFHDIGKVGFPGKPLYLKNECLSRYKDPYRVNPDVTYMGLASRSLYLISQYIPLSDAEAQVILYHDGQYIKDNFCVAHREEPLTLLVHWADYWTAHIYEEGRFDMRQADKFSAGGESI